MSPEEVTIIKLLDDIVRSAKVRALLDLAVVRTCEDLRARPKSVMAWEPLPLAPFGELPRFIRSAWIFVLRAGSNTGPERHPNSHQRMMSYAGVGDLQTRATADEPWQSNVLISDSNASLEQRWISIPQNIWHQPVISPDDDWVVVSFHTVPAEDLIEERPDPARGIGTKQMHYVDTRQSGIIA
ncbi:MAG TPA: hypothetical protein VJ719_15005 [Chthoniobacterales bacterium]|nr:hypothetical protein [Chthoniobacterales bacterium]